MDERNSPLFLRDLLHSPDHVAPQEKHVRRRLLLTFFLLNPRIERVRNRLPEVEVLVVAIWIFFTLSLFSRRCTHHKLLHLRISVRASQLIQTFDLCFVRLNTTVVEEVQDVRAQKSTSLVLFVLHPFFLELTPATSKRAHILLCWLLLKPHNHSVRRNPHVRPGHHVD